MPTESETHAGTWQRAARALGLELGPRGLSARGWHRGHAVTVSVARHQATVGPVTCVRLLPHTPLPAGLRINRDGPTRTPPPGLAQVAQRLLERAPLSAVDSDGLLWISTGVSACPAVWCAQLDELADLAAQWDQDPSARGAAGPHWVELQRLVDPRTPTVERDALVRILGQATLPLPVQVVSSHLTRGWDLDDQTRGGRTLVGLVGATRVNVRCRARDSARIRLLQPGSLLRLRARLSHFDELFRRPVFEPVC